MRAWIQLLLCLSLAALTGCQAAFYGTAQDFNKISVGMSKAEAIQKLGEPASTAAFPGGEYLTYRRMAAVVSDWPKDYFVKVIDDKVVSFGRKGDFDSTKNATVDLNVRSATTSTVTTTDRDKSSAVPSSKLAELEQLFKLKQQGAISDDEYQAQKAKLLAN